MNSSPETSTPAENLPLKPGSLNLTENHEHPALDPERILDALKKRAESAVTKEEREKFQKLADKLSATLVSKSEQAVDGTKDAWTKLRSEISPEQKKILQDAETALKTGTAKLEDVARSTIAKSQEIGGQVVEAARTGNVTELKKLAADVEETVNDAGQKVMKYSGAKAFEKMLEPLKTQGIAGIFAVIMNFWKFLTGGMKWSEVVEGAQTQVTGVVAAGTATAQAALGRTETAIESFRNMTPKELEKLTIKMADGIADDLSKTYFGGAKLSEDKIKKIRGIVASSNLRPEELQKIAKQIQEKGKITIENLAQILGTVSTGATELMWKIAFSGIVPLKHIAYEAVASGSKTAVGLTFYGLGLPPMTMTIEGIHALISKYSPISWSGKEKEMSLVQLELYRPLGIFWAVTSWIISNIAKLGIAIGADTASGANGFPVLGWLTGIGGDYQSVFKEFELINQKFAALPNNPNTQGMSKIIDELKTGMDTMTKNWKIIAVLDEVKYDQAKFLAHPELSKVLNVAQISKIKQSSNFQTALKDIVGAPPARDLKINNMRMFFGTGDGVIQKYLRDMDNVRWFQNLLVSSDKWGIEKLNRLRDYVNTMKLIRQGDTVLLHLEDVNDVKNFQALRKLLAEFPEGIRWLGSILPAGAFVVTMSHAVSSDASSSEVVDSLKTVLVPIVGGWQLIKNVGVNFEDLKNGKLPTLTDAGVAALGMTIITFEGMRIAGWINEAAVQVFRHGDIKWAARTVAKTAFMHPIDIAKSVGYMSRGAMHLSKAAPAMYSQMSKVLMKAAEKMPKKWRLAIVAGLLIGSAAGASALMKKDNLELEFDLKKQGYLDSKWELTQKFYTEFQDKDAAKKSEILKDLFWALVDTAEKRPKVNFDEQTREFAIVTKKSEEKNWWQSVLDTDTSFRDQLMRMGIDVVVICEEDIAMPIERKTEKILKI